MQIKHDIGTISYFLNDSVLQILLKFKNLSVIVDKKLKFEDHCFEVICKCNLVCYFITKVFSKLIFKEYFDFLNIH